MYLEGFMLKATNAKQRLPTYITHLGGLLLDVSKLDLLYRKVELQSKPDKSDVIFL